MNTEQQLRERAEAIWEKHFGTWVMAGQIKREGLKAMIDFLKQELQRIGEVKDVTSDNKNSIDGCDAPFDGNKAIEQKAEEILYDMMKENSPKMLQFFLSCLAKEMHKTNATDLELSCHLDLPDRKRYKIVSRSELCPIESLNDERIATQQAMPNDTDAGIK